MSWQKVKLGDVCDFVTGKTPPTSESKYFDGGVLWVTPSDFISKSIDKTGRTLSDLAIIDRKCNFLPKDTVVLSCIGDIGKVGILTREGCTNQQITAILPSNLFNSSFLYYLLMFKRNELTSLANSAVVPILNNANLRRLEIPLPPLDVQKKIADILDTADALRKKDAELIKKYDELAQSIFIDMFGDPVTNPKGWDIVQMGGALDFMTSGSRGWAQYYSNCGDVFLRINNIGYNKLKLEDIVYVSAPNSAESIRTQVKPNDIILSITADLGRTAVIPYNFPRAFINQHLAILRIKNKFNPFFISQVLSSDLGKMQFKSLTKGGVKAGLNFDDIRSLNFINPPLVLQDSFMHKINSLSQQLNIAENVLNNSEQLFQSLLQRAFNGELVH